MSQTTVQKPNSLRFGSTKLLLGDNVGSLVDVGAIRGMSFVSKAENSEVQFDNCPSITKFLKGDRGSFTFSLAEVDLTTLSKTEAGLVNITLIAGTPVAGATQVTVANMYAYDEFILIENQNGNGSAITVNSVTGSVDGALTVTTDYVVIKNGQGQYGIILVSGGNITTLNQTFTINYDYTPNAGKKITFNTTGQKIGKYARIINTNSSGKTLRVDIQDVTNITALELPFVSDNEDDVMVAEMELEGVIVEIVDEQSVA